MSGNGGATSPPHFTLSGVTVRRGDRTILDGVTTTIPGQRITVLFGPSGAGKSSLLRLLNRLDEATSGRITHRGAVLQDIPVRALRHRVGFVAQTPVLLPGTVRDNLVEAGVLAGLAGKTLEDRIQQVLAQAGLPGGLLDRPGAELSGGERQRAVLARALVSRPCTLLLDEPTSALDRLTAGHLLETLRALRDGEGLTVVLTTHRLEEIRGTADHAVMMQEGRIMEVGDAERLLTEPEEEATRAFVGWVRERGNPAV